LLFFKAAFLIPDFRPDLIHAHLHEGAFIGYFLKKLAGVPLVFDYQGSLTGECIDHGFFGATSRMAALFRRIERMSNGFADRVITSSSAATDDLVKNWGVQPQRVTPLIDAVDTDIFCPGTQREGRELLGISPDSFVVAYLGILSRYQGTDLLLDCIELLKTGGIRALFLIMGFPDERYRREAEARGLSDMIHFTGKVDYNKAPLMLSAADIAVTPKLSPTEANGKIFNYMACGLPVVAFDTPVNREVLGNTGVYATYGDSQDLAAKITTLLEGIDTRSGISDKVRNKALREHSWNTRGRQLSEVYRVMLTQQP
ncbi:MAG: glycosyltransferase family 4 protein, partial [Acidobacteria bacterium]|nr:glycosyltransferase family 4 protein [Acidobacteriota bacterium]